MTQKIGRPNKKDKKRFEYKNREQILFRTVIKKTKKKSEKKKQNF